MNLPDWTIQMADAAQAYSRPILFGAGAVGALLGALLIWRFLRTGHAHTRVGFLAVVLATAFAAEGMWEVATGPMNLPPVMAAGLFGMFEVVMVSQGLLAKHKLTQNPPGDVRRHMNFVWAVAGASGIIAATSASSVPEFLLRLCAPAVGAGIWWMGITADKPAGAIQPTSWIWTPRRIGIRLGLIKPGQQDLAKVDRDQRIDAITVTAHRLHHGSPRLARYRKGKLRRLALQADDVMVAEAQQRVARVNRIEKLTSPDAPSLSEPNDAERDLMDELRRVTTQATTRIRADHARAFGLARPEPLVELGGIRMPAHLAAQIPPQPEPVREPEAGSSAAAAVSPPPAQRRVTERLTKPAQTDTADKIRQAHARLTKRLKREPTNPELADEAAVSLATVKRWKSRTS